MDPTNTPMLLKPVIDTHSQFVAAVYAKSNKTMKTMFASFTRTLAKDGTVLARLR